MGSILFKVIAAVLLYLAVERARGDENAPSPRDLLEQVLRIPNPEKVLNSVLGKLKQNKHERLLAAAALEDQEDEECLDPTEFVAPRSKISKVLESLDDQGVGGHLGVKKILEEFLLGFPEYADTMYDIRDRGLRQLGVQKHYPICHVERKIHHLNSDEYEYKPAYYEQVECARPSRTLTLEDAAGNQLLNICSSLGFACVQWNKTIHLTRRRYNSDCWETKTMLIPAGCECMWPAHRLGDIKLHL